jgi:hypothetical protein
LKKNLRKSSTTFYSSFILLSFVLHYRIKARCRLFFLVEVELGNTRFRRRKNALYIYLQFSLKPATGIQYLPLCLSSSSGSEQIFSWFNLEYGVVSQNVSFFYEVISTKVYLPFTLYLKLRPNSGYRVLMYFPHQHTHQCVFMTLVIILVTWTTIKCNIQHQIGVCSSPHLLLIDPCFHFYTAVR